MGSTCSCMQPMSAPSTPDTSLSANPVCAITVESKQAEERQTDVVCSVVRVLSSHPPAARVEGNPLSAPRVESYPLSAVPQNSEKGAVPAPPPVPRYPSYGSGTISPSAATAEYCPTTPSSTTPRTSFDDARDDSSPGRDSQLTAMELRSLVQIAWTASENNAK